MENWSFQMSPDQAKEQLSTILGDLQKHQSEFEQQTRIDSVDVIVRRKDKKLEPLEKPSKNMAQTRVNLAKLAS